MLIITLSFRLTLPTKTQHLYYYTYYYYYYKKDPFILD